MNPLFEKYATENCRTPESQLVEDIGEYEKPSDGFDAWQNRKLDEFAALNGLKPNANDCYEWTEAQIAAFNAWISQ